MILGDHYCGAKCAWLHRLQGEFPLSSSFSSLAMTHYHHSHNCHHFHHYIYHHHHHAGDFVGDCYKWWLERILVDPGEKPWCRPPVQIPRGVLQRVNICSNPSNICSNPSKICSNPFKQLFKSLVQMFKCFDEFYREWVWAGFFVQTSWSRPSFEIPGRDQKREKIRLILY